MDINQIYSFVLYPLLILAIIMTLVFLTKLFIKIINLLNNINGELDRNKDTIASTLSNVNDITTVATSIALDVSEVTTSINNKVQGLDTMLASMHRGITRTNKMKDTYKSAKSVVGFFKKKKKD